MRAKSPRRVVGSLIATAMIARRWTLGLIVLMAAAGPGCAPGDPATFIGVYTGHSVTARHRATGTTRVERDETFVVRRGSGSDLALDLGSCTYAAIIGAPTTFSILEQGRCEAFAIAGGWGSIGGPDDVLSVYVLRTGSSDDDEIEQWYTGTR